MFYTNVVRYSNFILYRGYDDLGKKVFKKKKFKPKFFVPSKTETGWRGLDGNHIGEIDFDSMREHVTGWNSTNMSLGFKSMEQPTIFTSMSHVSFPKILDLIVIRSMLPLSILRQNTKVGFLK